MGRAASLGKRVVVLDEAGNWRGIGTAWHLAEEGHDVTIVTPSPMVARDLIRSATDLPARRSLAALGVRFVTESAISEWTGSGANLVCLLSGRENRIEADALVLATGNIVDRTLHDDLRSRGIHPRLVGDVYAPRLAAAAIYEGRVTGLTL